jgi:hypothetical protein
MDLRFSGESAASQNAPKDTMDCYGNISSIGRVIIQKRKHVGTMRIKSTCKKTFKKRRRLHFVRSKRRLSGVKDLTLQIWWWRHSRQSTTRQSSPSFSIIGDEMQHQTERRNKTAEMTWGRSLQQCSEEAADETNELTFYLRCQDVLCGDCKCECDDAFCSVR